MEREQLGVGRPVPARAESGTPAMTAKATGTEAMAGWVRTASSDRCSSSKTSPVKMAAVAHTAPGEESGGRTARRQAVPPDPEQQQRDKVEAASA
jgi:hypothetical protein